MAAKARKRPAAIGEPPPMQPVPVLQSDPYKPVHPSGYEGEQFPARLFEWVTSLMMVGVALIVTINPKSIQFGGFYLMAEIGLTAPVLGILYFGIGLGRIAALIANGTSCFYGPAMRAVGALVGVIVWAQMLHALIAWSLKGGYLSIGTAVYVFLVLGEGISCYRAAADVRSKRY